jgi:hypothetical protein
LVDGVLDLLQEKQEMRRFTMILGCALVVFSATLVSAQEQKPAQAPAQAPAGKAVQAPAQAPAQKAVQAPVQAPVQKVSPAQKPVQAPAQKAVQAPTQKPIQSPVQKGGDVKMARVGFFGRAR